jgi:NhaP-type Na+/H+ or K+/H+ antiporter
VPAASWWFVPLLLLVIRPLSVVAAGTQFMAARGQLPLIAWFGIRGIGSIYYLMFALNRGLPSQAAQLMFGLTLVTVAWSIVLHGISITPLMDRYQRARRRAPERAAAGDEPAAVGGLEVKRKRPRARSRQGTA